MPPGGPLVPGARRLGPRHWLLLLLLACLAAAVAVSGAAGFWGREDESRLASGVHLEIVSAKTLYYQEGPSDPVVEVRVELVNHGLSATDSATLLWDPQWNSTFTFLYSEPPAWRVRTDDRGRGVLDTAGMVPRSFGRYRLFFAVGTYAVREPTMLVVANGNVEVGEWLAGASHLKWEAPKPAQQTFERGGLAALADLLALGPSDPRGAFVLALALAVILSVVTVSGGTAALVAAAQQGKQWRPTIEAVSLSPARPAASAGP